ncbi:hypothetical protein CEXT_326661 [Caerostris extrusa]|uniref:Uncharacterized protein n=1 Tax=Caerostris extrusa TaxID=172846 RepID=A0AAV4SQ96_CAEEX|nr:hypothetical protein CEXT_326661 [Caerostris extrusa]
MKFGSKHGKLPKDQSSSWNVLSFSFNVSELNEVWFENIGMHTVGKGDRCPPPPSVRGGPLQQQSVKMDYLAKEMKMGI